MAAALARASGGRERFVDAEVLDWQTLAPEMVTLVRITDLAGLLVLLLVFIAAAAGVANTMVMATFERTREFGMLLALGTHPSSPGEARHRRIDDARGGRCCDGVVDRHRAGR